MNLNPCNSSTELQLFAVWSEGNNHQTNTLIRRAGRVAVSPLPLAADMVSVAVCFGGTPQPVFRVGLPCAPPVHSPLVVKRELAQGPHLSSIDGQAT